MKSRGASVSDRMSDDQKPPEALEKIARVVLAYHPKPKSKPAKARKRRAAKIAQGGRDGRS